MAFKDEVCMWFKDSQSHHRLELICSLLNMCLPFELRFIRTCVDELGKRDDIREFDSKANSSNEISQLGKILDERTRSKFILYGALLEPNNQTCSKLLYEKLLNSEDHPDFAVQKNEQSTVNYVKEMLLIYTLVLHHPAFTFEEKRVIGERFTSLQQIEVEFFSKESWTFKRKSCSQIEISNDAGHPILSPPVYEACDSGLSIGTEPDVELLSDNVCNSTDIHLGQTRFPSSDNASFDGNKELRQEPEANAKPVHNNPSILQDHLSPTSISCQEVPLSLPAVKGDAPSGSNQLCPNQTEIRDASSSGSAGSVELPVYEEKFSVPTTYIYNSNIYDQSINEVPVPDMTLSNNVLNMSPAYMCPHNSCPCYQYPLMNGDSSRKQAVNAETSSSEEGTSVIKSERVSLNSPSTSSPSSPYASPPQSLSPSRATSPSTVDNPATSSQAIVTGTTTSVVVSRSSPKLLSRHSSSSSGNGSQPSSPALANNTYRSKPIMTPKNSRFTSDSTKNRKVGSFHSQILVQPISVESAVDNSKCVSGSNINRDQMQESSLGSCPQKAPPMTPHHARQPSTAIVKPVARQLPNDAEPKHNYRNPSRVEPGRENEEKENKANYMLNTDSQANAPLPIKKSEDCSLLNGVKESSPVITNLTQAMIPNSVSMHKKNEQTKKEIYKSLYGTNHHTQFPNSNSRLGPVGINYCNQRDPKSTTNCAKPSVPAGKINVMTTTTNTTNVNILVPPPGRPNSVDKLQHHYGPLTSSQVPRPPSSLGNSIPTTTMVTPHSMYPPFLPFMHGTNVQHNSYPNPQMRNHPQTYLVPSAMIHGNHMKCNKSMVPPPRTMMSVPKPRTNNGRSGSTSSSSSSGLSRKKNLTRGKRSSDSSPSSSQYSSPPQTPSPDHTKDVRKKQGKDGQPYEETWDEGKAVPEEGPPMPLPQMMMNPMRQRLIPYHHHPPVSFMGYPTNPMFRYSPSVLMGPRPPTPSEKTSREATPPTNADVGPLSSSPPMEISPYNNYMFTSPFVTTQFFPPPQGSNLPNGYPPPHSLPPNFMNSELVYSGGYAMQSSKCRGQPNLQPTPYPYANPPPANIPKKPFTCYNCGLIGHHGSECKEASIDDLTKRTKVL